MFQTDLFALSQSLIDQRRFPGGPAIHWVHPGSSDRLQMFFGRVLFKHHAHAGWTFHERIKHRA